MYPNVLFTVYIIILLFSNNIIYFKIILLIYNVDIYLNNKVLYFSM
jgi:hypothetical protein